MFSKLFGEKRPPGGGSSRSKPTMTSKSMSALEKLQEVCDGGCGAR